MFKRILIANRGEIALRVIRTCREMGTRSVAVYSTADANSLHVRFADEAVCIGPPASKDSYLKIPDIIAAARIANADAIHPGYGLLSENAKFSKICAKRDIKFIGTLPEMIERMDDKASARVTMKEAGVPTVPDSDGLAQSLEYAKRIMAEIGYPIMLKVTAEGGGRGMHSVWKEGDLGKALDNAMQEAGTAFGNDTMYMEKLIVDPHRTEIQIVGDQYGKAYHLSEHDCSIQRRRQKLTEEAPSPFMTGDLRKRMDEAAVKAVKYIRYEEAGTIEFLVDKDYNFYFMEMSTRMQVEHPVTEQVTDYDLIKGQILVTAGMPISGKNYTPKLRAIEYRINTEDPYNDFRPSPGKITTLHAPGGHGVCLDTYVYSGYTIPPNYNSMVAKLITTTQTHEEAITKICRALNEFVVEGVKTTTPFHLQLMSDPDYLTGGYTTKFMENFKMKPQVGE